MIPHSRHAPASSSALVPILCSSVLLRHGRLLPNPASASSRKPPTSLSVSTQSFSRNPLNLSRSRPNMPPAPDYSPALIRTLSTVCSSLNPWPKICRSSATTRSLTPTNFGGSGIDFLIAAACAVSTNTELRANKRLDPFFSRQAQAQQFSLAFQVDMKIKERAALALRRHPFR